MTTAAIEPSLREGRRDGMTDAPRPADIAYFVTGDDLSERSVAAKHRPEFRATRVGLVMGVHHRGAPLTGWLAMGQRGEPVVVITDENGLLVSDGGVRTSDERFDVASVTALVIETWQLLLANKEVREFPRALNDLRPLIEGRAESLGLSVVDYLCDLVFAEARAASAREHALASGRFAVEKSTNQAGEGQ